MSGRDARVRPLRLVVLISGGGRTLMNLVDNIEAGTLAARVERVIASRGDAPGVERARARGLDVRVAARADFPDEASMHDQIDAWIDEVDPDLVCLAGYLRKIRMRPALEGRVINIHPALLPDFGGQGMYGVRVHEAVIAAGCRETGCTVHFVDEQYDHGPTILQRRCEVRPADDVDTLAARVFEEECRAYPEAINRLARGEIRWEDGRVVAASDARA